MTKPEIGDPIWVYLRHLGSSHNGPFAGFITRVWETAEGSTAQKVSAAWFNEEGVPRSDTSFIFVHEEDFPLDKNNKPLPPLSSYCIWTPARRQAVQLLRDLTPEFAEA